MCKQENNKNIFAHTSHWVSPRSLTFTTITAVHNFTVKQTIKFWILLMPIKRLQLKFRRLVEPTDSLEVVQGTGECLKLC